MTWPKRPSICEINTWPWLDRLSRRHGRAVTLDSVPPAEWEAIAALGFDAVLLLGVWERSPCSALIAREDDALKAEARRLLPDLTPADLIGSPCAAYRHEAAGRLGGTDGLAAARRALAGRDVRLLLDLAADRTAVDHPWVFERPELFLRGTDEELRSTSSVFFEAGGLVFSLGRRAGGAPWPDLAQLNVFSPAVRAAMRETLSGIAAQCDGIRCESAALALNDVFRQTWGQRAGAPPAREFWSEVIAAVHSSAPDLLLLADGCEGREWELLQQGFDFCFDQHLGHRLRHGDAGDVRAHLSADTGFQERLVRSVEDRGADGALAWPSLGHGRAVALVATTLPGAKVVQATLASGLRTGCPLPLGRLPDGPVDAELKGFYRSLLPELRAPAFRSGEWRLCETSGWPDNDSHRNLVAWCWASAEDRRLIAVNLSPEPSQGLVRVPWNDLGGRPWRLADAFSGEIYERSGDDMAGPGLYVGLDPWGIHLLRLLA